jgi:hypothetical protein
MQHAAHELTGTFLGHVVPGTVLMALGLWWLWHVGRDLATARASAGAQAAGASWRVRAVFAPSESWLLIGIATAAAVGDLWWASWRLTDTSVMNYQHATAYAGFALAGVVDLLARRGHVPGYVPHLAMAGAFANAGFQFLAHGNHVMVSHAVHLLLTGLFLVEVAALLLELRYRHPALSVAKGYALVLLGAWFFQIAWILYRSGWDLLDPYNVMRVYLFFTWHVMGIALALSLAYALLAGAVAPAAGRARFASGVRAGDEVTRPTPPLA